MKGSVGVGIARDIGPLVEGNRLLVLRTLDEHDNARDAGRDDEKEHDFQQCFECTHDIQVSGYHHWTFLGFALQWLRDNWPERASTSIGVSSARPVPRLGGGFLFLARAMERMDR